MKISIIIVNYKVKFFLEQSLLSVYNATSDIEREIFVVDNNSEDDSILYLKERFPDVFFIENSDNVGFAKANNQAIKLAKGEFILLLNPDTLIGESTLHETINFMNSNKKAGALGVKMIDATGRFLPESKRSIPTPWVSFCKVFGLSAFFPHSKIFSRYSLGYLNKNKIHKIDILAGAFMLFRKDVIEKIGMLDESFFMYGEDIDISYRVIQGGYENYYLPSPIIHYKGESTPKHSIKYVKIFYEAMDIFFKKHNSDTSYIYTFFIRFAILFRGFLSGIYRVFYRISEKISPSKPEDCNILIVSDNEESTIIKEIIKKSDIYINSVSLENFKLDISKFNDLIKDKNITDIILSDSIYKNDEIINIIENLGELKLTFSIHLKKSQTVISPGMKFNNNIHASR